MEDLHFDYPKKSKNQPLGPPNRGVNEAVFRRGESFGSSNGWFFHHLQGGPGPPIVTNGVSSPPKNDRK